MFGILSFPEIEKLLSKQVIGRIGCYYDDKVYVVPISYFYDGQYIYCHTYEGRKIEMMRKNPKVCFQVDHLQNMANWQSVIAYGEFEELTEPLARKNALQKLHERQLPMISSETVHLSADWPFIPSELNKISGIAFRIRVDEKTGRFEKTHGAEEPFFNF
jgi:nitroimidazol reductase NimA-like FMN-containing flavoprotein (pyridoxamine 5'-phosphate oxidase superfamily)